MNYLELCQKLNRKSGTADGNLPSTVAGQTGRSLKICNLIEDGYREIQNQSREWLWLQSTFSGVTISGQRDYAGSDMGVASRFGSFVCTMDDNEDRFTIYQTSLGVADEGQLRFMPYKSFYTTFMRGTQTNDKPQFFTIQPDGKILLHPIPDADGYTVKGPYRKSPQTLAVDGDTPEMPTHFHDLVVEAALMQLAVHDESPQAGGWQLHKLTLYNQLRRDQLPKFERPPVFA
mgnify:CR=1 FL=1